MQRTVKVIYWVAAHWWHLWLLTLLFYALLYGFHAP